MHFRNVIALSIKDFKGKSVIKEKRRQIAVHWMSKRTRGLKCERHTRGQEKHDPIMQKRKMKQIDCLMKELYKWGI